MGRGKCQDCLFWDRIGASSLGECHRYAPGVSHAAGPVWPRTVADSGCGEFEARAAAVPSAAEPTSD